MSEYWIVSVPQSDNTLSEQKAKVGKLASVHKLEMPHLRFGSLDELMLVSDELVRVESQCENLVHRLVDILGEVDGSVGDFAWNQAKYPCRLTVKEMRELLEKEVLSMESELKGRAGEYNKLKSSVEESRRRRAAGLQSRPMYEVAEEGDFVLDSEHLVTLVVVVGKSMCTTWLNSYSTLTDMVVPDSSRRIAEDDDYAMFTVTLFRGVVDDFRGKCRAMKVAVRDFEYSREDAKAYQANLTATQNRLSALQHPFLNWVKINYHESFSALLHIKILRSFIESVLRFGLTTPFLTTVLHPSNPNKLRSALHDLYSSLDQHFPEDDLRIPGQPDYSPFPLFKLTIDWN